MEFSLEAPKKSLAGKDVNVGKGWERSGRKHLKPNLSNVIWMNEFKLLKKECLRGHYSPRDYSQAMHDICGAGSQARSALCMTPLQDILFYMQSSSAHLEHPIQLLKTCFSEHGFTPTPLPVWGTCFQSTKDACRNDCAIFESQKFWFFVFSPKVTLHLSCDAICNKAVPFVAAEDTLRQNTGRGRVQIYSYFEEGHRNHSSLNYNRIRLQGI